MGKVCINLVIAVVALLSFASLQALSVAWPARLDGAAVESAAVDSPEAASEGFNSQGSTGGAVDIVAMVNRSSDTSGRIVDTTVPMPATMGLFGVALLELGIMRRRRAAA